MKKNINSLIFIINIIFFILIILFYNFFDYIFNDILIVYVLSTVFILLLIFSLRVEKYEILRKNYFKHSTLVLLGLVVVGFQRYLDYYLGYIDKSDLLRQVSDEAAAKSLLISLIGLISFFLGFLLKRNNYSISIEKKYFKANGTSFLTVLSLFFLLGFLFTINPLYVFGGYGIHEMGLTAIYYAVLFKASIFALIIQKVINLSATDNNVQSFWGFIKGVGYINILIILIYSSIVILSGDRGDVIALGLLMVIGYMNSSNKSITRVKSILLIFAAAFIITILGIARSFNTLDDSSFISNISQSFSEESKKDHIKSIIPITAELSGSVKALQYSVEYVPSQYDYVHSRFYIQSIIGVIPFSSIVLPYIYSDNSFKYNSSDGYVTWLIAGDNPTSGQGTSTVADFYLSYGLLGVILGMGFFGWLIRYSEQHIEFSNSKYLIVIIISIVMFTSSIFLSRTSLFASFRLIIWIWVLILLNRWLTSRLSR